MSESEPPDMSAAAFVTGDELKVIVFEEHGYAEFDFVYFGTKEQLIAEFRAEGFKMLKRQNIRILHHSGRRTETAVARQIYTTTEDIQQYDARMFTDMEESSGLLIDGVHYDTSGNITDWDKQ